MQLVEICREFIACGLVFRYYRVTYRQPDGSTFERFEAVELPKLLPQGLAQTGGSCRAASARLTGAEGDPGIDGE